MRKSLIIQFALVGLSLVILLYVAVLDDSSYVEVDTEIVIRTGDSEYSPVGGDEDAVEEDELAGEASENQPPPDQSEPQATPVDDVETSYQSSPTGSAEETLYR